jgi:arylsulfatase A-like enzyme
MKVIMVMFDSLNRHMLPPYGGDWVHAPNFKRLAERTVTFDQSYVCSMPCMPARRDFQTGRPNFLHRSWGPLEPFDDSVPEMLKKAGVYTHLVTDHYHYFEEGGATYHTRYNTFEYFRGQEGDPWYPQVAPAPEPQCVSPRSGPWWNQDWKNRSVMPREELQPQSLTFNAGIDFIKRNGGDDNWFLQIETFDPHEPFFTQRKYKDLYSEHYDNYRGRHFDWPPYAPVSETVDEVEHCRYEYASLVSMCDQRMGDILDIMDAKQMWDDTMLIVWTDHGFLLGEHDCWAKVWTPFYEEVAHTPFFIWDPRCGKKGERRSAIVQPSIDLGPTLLEFFGVPLTEHMRGKALGRTIADDTPVRDAAIFGLHGGHVNIVDGTHIYMRGPATANNGPLFNYTLMPTNMRHTFSVEELRNNIELAEPFSFTKGVRTMKISATGRLPGGEDIRLKRPTLLYNLVEDPTQKSPIHDAAVEQRLATRMAELMREYDAPVEQYERMGLRTS